MIKKLFTPLKVGEFDLQHRIVLELQPSPDPMTGPRAVDLTDTLLSGGLAIVDEDVPCELARMPRPPYGPDSGHTQQSWQVGHAKPQRRSVLVRLHGHRLLDHLCRRTSIDELTRADIRSVISNYVDWAHRAKLEGADGIELDASAGSMAYLFLTAFTNRRRDQYGGSVSGREQFLLEVIEALAPAFGRDRVGVRLSPFLLDITEGERRTAYTQIMRSLDDQEIAYVHIELGETGSLQALNASPFATALRHSYPGIFIVTGQRSLAAATELVERRWADAACFRTSDVDAQLIDGMRRARSDAEDK